MPSHIPLVPCSLALLAGIALVACSDGGTSSASAESTSVPVLKPFADGKVAGNPAGTCSVPADALPDSIASERMVGDGTPQSCTESAFREAVSKGGRIGFACGKIAVTITLTSPAKIDNAASPEVVIDGQGLVTLSGGGTSRILYMNTCDPAQHWTTSHCQDQDHPRLTVQNLTFVDGNSVGESESGGGAIWARGGRLKVVNCRFYRNRTDSLGPDVGGGAIRAFSQSRGLPIHVLNGTFGDRNGEGNVASNGGALSSIGTSWSIWNSLFVGNRAVGNGGNPAQANTPGGGSGGAIYNDGNTMTLSVCGTRIESNQVNAYGAAIFFVTNDLSGDMRLTNSVIRSNIGGSWHVLPGIAMHEATRRTIINSTLEN